MLIKRTHWPGNYFRGRIDYDRSRNGRGNSNQKRKAFEAARVCPFLSFRLFVRGCFPTSKSLKILELWEDHSFKWYVCSGISSSPFTVC